MPTFPGRSRHVLSVWRLINTGMVLLLASCSPLGRPSADPPASLSSAASSAAAPAEPASLPTAVQSAEAAHHAAAPVDSTADAPAAETPSSSPPGASEREQKISPPLAHPEPPSPPPVLQRPYGELPHTLVSGTASFLPQGEAKFEVPVVCVQANYGADPEGVTLCPPEPLTCKDYRLTVREARGMAMYWMSTGYGGGISLLAPADWSVFEAVMGANGSVGFSVQHPKDPKQMIVYSDSGGCQGCVVPNIATFFPEMAKWAEEQGYILEGPSREFARRIPISLDLVSYSLKDREPRYETHGVATKENNLFRLLEITVKPGSRRFATASLNFFADTERQRIPQTLSQ
ncbi:DUF4850 domain-containing protein [Paenibacillus sp. S-38]|uniref:DUF4850 domain-containing protein n=1 Tax=Paenibacillus sp. S-38 TaxID=3416710 RepID=UPI003CF9A27D